MRHRFRPTRDRIGPEHSRGQSIVELALTLPLLLLLLLGTIDIGRVFFDYIQMRDAALEGATYGARSPTDTKGITQRVTLHGIPTDAVVDTPVQTGSCLTLNGAGDISVTVRRTFTPITVSALVSIAPGVDWTIDVVATTKARCMT